MESMGAEIILAPEQFSNFHKMVGPNVQCLVKLGAATFKTADKIVLYHHGVNGATAQNHATVENRGVPERSRTNEGKVPTLAKMNAQH